VANSFILSSGSVVTTDASTKFVPFGRLTSFSTTESDVETAVRDGGVFSNLFVNVTQNDIASATSATVTLRLSRANTAVTISYGTSQTGIKEDNAHTVTALNTDEANFAIVATSVSGAHTITVTSIGCQFAPTAASCITFLVATEASPGLSEAVTTQFYFTPLARLGAGVGSVKFRVRDAFTATHLFGNIKTNSRTGSTFLQSLKNGSGVSTLTYTTTQTGQKEDTTTSVSYAAGDDYQFSCSSAGTGTYVVCLMSEIFTHTGSTFPLLSGAPVGVTQNFNVTNNFPISGALEVSLTESVVSAYPRFDCTLRELGVFTGSNSIATSDTVITVRDGAANGALTVSYSVAQSGLKNDSVNSVSVASGVDLINYQVVTPNTSGAIIILWLSVLASLPSTFRPSPPYMLSQALKRSSLY
jgi:hypothetical protein